MTFVRQFVPKNVYCRFKVLTAFIKKVYVRRVFDVRRRYRCIHKELSAVLLLTLELVLRRVLAGLAYLRRRIVSVVIVIVAIYAADLIRYLAGTDRLVDLCEILNRETLAECLVGMRTFSKLRTAGIVSLSSIGHCQDMYG